MTEMEIALEADGEKLRQLIGEDHGPHQWWEYECEDCIGMIDFGCYCAAMGAKTPGGPLDDTEYPPCDTMNALAELTL